MRLLSLCLGRELLTESSFALQRQREYYRDWQVDLVCLGVGAAQEKSIDQLRMFAPGGQNKVMALWRTYHQIRELMQTNQYDALTSQDAQWTGLLGWLANRTRHLPWQIQDHSNFFAREPFFFGEKVLAPLAKWLVKQATRVRTVSERGKQGMIKRGVPASRIDVVPVYTSLSAIKPRPVHSIVKTVLSVGRLEKEKGYAVLLRAWKEANLKNVTLLIAGDGSERSSLEQLAQALAISSSVVFLGWQSQAQLAAIWEQADVYVQPSWFEGWPRAPWEALQYHLPCILTETGFVGEVVTEKEVVIVPPGKVGQLAQALTTLANHTDRRLALSQAVQRRLETLVGYDAASLTQKTRQSILSLVEPSRTC